MFGPLSFPTDIDTSHDFFPDEETIKSTACMICDEEFLLSRPDKDFLLHLLSSHNLVIQDINKIACLKKYVEYWKMRLRCGKLEEFGFKTIRRIDLDGTSDSYGITYISKHNLTGSSTDKIFVMSNDLSEDKILRENLQTQRLEFVLEQQKQEREITDYCRECLFCHTEITGSTSDYLEHLSGKHNLFLGKPQNLVFVKQLINTIENKLLNLRCLFCEKIFKDRNALKEHMRKKLHKRINPKNTEYDRFYIVNYLEMGKNWKNIDRVGENESPDSDGSDSDWSDWREEVQIQIVCLFCKNNSVTWDDTLQHMEIEHNFNYKESTIDMDFYQQVKLINYIRRQIHRLSCIVCDYISDNNEKLLDHLNNQNHFKLPDKSMWDQPEYFFPTYENDLFLCHLDDGACESETTSINDVQPAD